ncbi:hypothetical protein BV22DRAFT_1052208 [Leucogyrophana mollusca]|uniref:Uncharacterized protein n=1 Tax=Leucogyrophana mollusca TaxID=85980 RepID=A0ACB8AX59_9AGAM|nr:hypothetical protein BV22DRAFT_1052208 [Leucogyrophana mollusca]
MSSPTPKSFPELVKDLQHRVLDMPALGSSREAFCAEMISTVEAMRKVTDAALLAPPDAEVLDRLRTAMAEISQRLDSSHDATLATLFPELMPVTVAALRESSLSGPMDINSVVAAAADAGGVEARPVSARTVKSVAPSISPVAAPVVFTAHVPSASAGSAEEVATALAPNVSSAPTLPTTSASVAAAHAPSPAPSTAPITTLVTSATSPPASPTSPPASQLPLPSFPPAPMPPPLTIPGRYEFRLVDGVPVFNIPPRRGDHKILMGYGPGGKSEPVYQLPRACFCCLGAAYLCFGDNRDGKCYHCHIDRKPCNAWNERHPLANWSPQREIASWAAAPPIPEPTPEPTPAASTASATPATRSLKRKATVKKEPRSAKAVASKGKGKAVASPHKPSCPRKKVRARSPSVEVSGPTPRVVCHFFDTREIYNRCFNDVLMVLAPLFNKYEAALSLTPLYDSDDDSVEYVGERAADEESIAEDEEEEEEDEIYEDNTAAASSSRGRVEYIGLCRAFFVNEKITVAPLTQMHVSPRTRARSMNLDELSQALLDDGRMQSLVESSRTLAQPALSPVIIASKHFKCTPRRIEVKGLKCK